ncbi:uncharacterized protein LOC123610419 [Leopardus geoffroyi]|uniref:uncharacterized protein LOC123610419 n=1 Tax=Leopardus geoffroyi TaxID=46844 RepID=UPI001E2608CE|nr:uncharacterized protein LOC123610419 [Leopardus geoffroyi]
MVSRFPPALKAFQGVSHPREPNIIVCGPILPGAVQSSDFSTSALGGDVPIGPRPPEPWGWHIVSRHPFSLPRTASPLRPSELRGPGAQSNQGPRGLLLREAQATHPGPPLSHGSRLSSSLAFRGNTGALGSKTGWNRAESRFPAEAWLLAPWPRPTAALSRVQGSLAPVTCLRAPVQCPGHTWRAGLGRQGARQASEQGASQEACGAAGGARLQPARLDSECREPTAANALRGRGGTMTWTTGSFHLAWPTAGVPGT